MIGTINLPQASSMAGNVDALYSFILIISIVSFVIIVGALVYFSYKYSRKKSNPDTTSYIHGNTALEVGMSAVLFVIVMLIFAWGWIDYKKIRSVPANALEINVIGQQWLWNLEYKNGRQLTNELIVPKDTPVKLIMGSKDVLHSFYVPAFRLKQDVVPGQFTYISFTAIELGEFPIFCAEFCGTAHSGMIGKVKVVEKADYEKWQNIWELEQRLGVSEASEKSGEQVSPVERGKELFTKQGCTACHSTGSNKLVGPGLAGLFGRETTLSDGKKVSADENYIRKSLMEPNAEVVEGFTPLMPTYKGQLSDEELNHLIAYIKSLK